ncbi:MAG: hypothetical protein CSA32_04900 [Desulfobulbus propionicus]|nr:MAG: hypothetical protein CSA32_04900 [Desulfobulbus propionicus]
MYAPLLFPEKTEKELLYSCDNTVVFRAVGTGEKQPSASGQDSGRICSPLASLLLQRPFPINRADIRELQLLPGIGPGLAGKIYAFRQEHGEFHRASDLLDVPGIGEGKLRNLAPLISFEHTISPFRAR